MFGEGYHGRRKNKYDTPNPQVGGEPGSASATAQSILDRGAEMYGHAQQAVGEVYGKTTQAISETYEQAKSYSSNNPGKTLPIAGGVGLGFLLGANSRRSRMGRFAQPVVNALSDIALEVFR